MRAASFSGSSSDDCTKYWDRRQRLISAVKSRTEVLEVEMAVLVRARLEPRGVGPIRTLGLVFALAVFRVKEIAQDRK